MRFEESFQRNRWPVMTQCLTSRRDVLCDVPPVVRVQISKGVHVELVHILSIEYLDTWLLI